MRDRAPLRGQAGHTERFRERLGDRFVEVEGDAHPADGVAGLEFQHARRGFPGRVGPPEPGVRRRQQRVGVAPIGIDLETLLSRFRGRLIIATLELAECDREPWGALSHLASKGCFEARD